MTADLYGPLPDEDFLGTNGIYDLAIDTTDTSPVNCARLISETIISLESQD